MTYTPSLTESQVLTVLRSWIIDAVGPGIEVVLGLSNRVPTPKDPFICMTKASHESTSSYQATYADGYEALFTGTTSGTLLTVSAVLAGGPLAVGQYLAAGALLPFGVTIAGLGTGTGGVGTYILSADCGGLGPVTMQASTLQPQQETLTQPKEFAVQVDCYGPDAGDWSAMLVSIWDTDISCDFFNASSASIQPLYADTSRQSPLVGGEDQYEERWTTILHLQYLPAYNLPKQFMGSVTVTTVDVDASYAP